MESSLIMVNIDKCMRRMARRAHIQRLKKVRKKYSNVEHTTNEKVLGVYLTTPKVCTCWMCGNDRKFQKERTIQEKRMMQILD